MPTGLPRVKLDKLKAEATQRSIPVQTAEGRNKTRDMLIRDIREHEDRASAKTSTSGAATRRTAAEVRRPTSVKRGPPNPDPVWMSFERPGGTGSNDSLNGSIVGPAALARAQELLGKMPPEDIQQVLGGELVGKQA